MATLPPWDELRSGQGCPLCLPRSEIDVRSFFVCRLAVSSLYLDRNQAYRGTCIVVYDAKHATRPSELTAAEWRDLCDDVRVAESALTKVLAPDHVNVEILGNTVPHLHVGIFPRYRSDPRWGHPIWTTSRADLSRVAASDTECAELARLVQDAIASTAERREGWQGI
jgi:diadenosine tetraphosphate (Ap4A) HIT family hydrolase